MFGSLGFPEILFILVLALLVFGPRRLPEMGRTIGRALGEFRRATGDLKRSIDREMSEAETGSARPAGPVDTASAAEPDEESPADPDRTPSPDEPAGS